MTSAHCPMIHGGLEINLKGFTDSIYIKSCCIRTDVIVAENNFWQHPSLQMLRNHNKKNIWSPGCVNCQRLENSNQESLRTGTLQKFGIETDLSGPKRLDLMFDIGCNLACRTCGPESSTFWQKHLKENNNYFKKVDLGSRADDMIEILKTLDLSNLELVVFCGGETLLGQGYWKVAEAIADLVPDAKNKITLSFQTNGTQEIAEKNYKIIEKFQLVKLNISIDAIGNRFEYMRWPADWNQVVDNIFFMRANLPSNTMFLIEETISIFNLYYQQELATWCKQNFSTNRYGDIINHTRHLARGIFELDGLTQEYVDAITNTELINVVPNNWTENPEKIKKMLDEINKFDAIRDQNWIVTFPEVAEFYSRYN